MKRPIRLALAAALAILVSAGRLLAQDNFTVRAGESLILTDPRYHTKLFNGTAFNPTLDVRMGWNDHSGRGFSELYGDPQFGFGASVDFLSMCNFQPGNSLSNVYNLYGYLDRPIVRCNGFAFSYTMALGMGYTNGLYHPVDNPYNMLFGQNITAHICIGFDLSYALQSGTTLGLGIFYNHNSNGTLQLPNCGYNGLELGLYVKQDTKKHQAPVHAPVKEEFKPRFYADVQVSGSASVLGSEFKYYNTLVDDPEQKQYRFPLYPRVSLNADAMYRYTKTLASGIGLDMFYLPCADRVHELEQKMSDEELPEFNPLSIGLSAQQEIFYANMSMKICVGAYLLKKDGINTSAALYQVLGLRYHMPQLGGTFVGLGLKVHYFTAADCILFSIGKSF